MRIRRLYAECLAAAVCLGVAGLVFQQAATDLVRQGIASGGPYDNAAGYPVTVAGCLVLLVGLQFAVSIFASLSRLPAAVDEGVAPRGLARPAAVLTVLFAYVLLLNPLGYYIATLAMMVAIMAICGLRNWLAVGSVAVFVTFGLAWVFEVVLLVSMPGGLFDLHMPW